MPDLSQRSNDVEIMDDLNCSGEVVYQTLRELETINYLLGGNYVTINGIARLLEHHDLSREIKITDLGCGSGDMLKLIRKWNLKKKIRLELTGVDANPNIVAYAEKHTASNLDIRYRTIDIFSPEFAKLKFDVVVGTLFFHHFTSSQLISFFRQLTQQTAIGIVVNDIHRHFFAYYSIKWLTGFFSRSAMVKYDAPVSVCRAFRKAELENILQQAGIKNFSIRWMWAFRWQVVIHTDGAQP